MIQKRRKEKTLVSSNGVKDRGHDIKEWLEGMFLDIEKTGEDRWGHQWRASQKLRYERYMGVLKPMLKQGMTILDVGCGAGNFTHQVWELAPESAIIGMDISERAIRYAQRTYPEITFMTGALPDVVLGEKKSFDLILCLEVLNYLDTEERRKAVERMSVLLKPGGRLLFSGVLDGGVAYFEENEIQELISQYLAIEKTEYNYAKLYTIMEGKFLLALRLFDLLKGVPLVRYMKAPLRKFLSWDFPPRMLNRLSRYLLREKGESHIIILARK